jgi:Mrp family chromosome partitioning ATPase
MGTEKQLAASGAVASAAAGQLGISLPELLSSVTVTVPVDTEVMQISASASTATEAQRRAEELADAYVAYKKTAPLSSVPELVRVITPALVPSAPIRPSVPLNSLVGLLAGLVLGVLIALVRDRLDDRVRGVDDVEQRGLDVLATVPALEPGSVKDSRLAEARAIEVSTAYQSLCEKLSRPQPRPGRVFMVTGTADGGIWSVAANFAAALAGTGRRVALVNALSDWTDDSESAKDLPDQPDVPGQREALPAALRDTVVPRLKLLPVGRQTSTRSDDAGHRWTDILMALRNSFGVVVVAVPPLFASADGARVARLVTGVVVAVDERSSTRSDLDCVAVELAQVRATVLGCVVRKVSDGARPSRRVWRLGRRKAIDQEYDENSWLLAAPIHENGDNDTLASDSTKSLENGHVPAGHLSAFASNGHVA